MDYTSIPITKNKKQKDLPSAPPARVYKEDPCPPAARVADGMMTFLLTRDDDIIFPFLLGWQHCKGNC